MLPLIANNSMSEMECYSEQKRQRFLLMADPLLGRLSFLSSISSNPTTTDHHIRVPSSSSSSSWYDDKRQCSPPSVFSSSSLEDKTDCDDINIDGDGINIDDDDDDCLDLDNRQCWKVQQRQHRSNDNKNKQLSNWITVHWGGSVSWDVLISYLFLPLMVELQFAIAAATMTSHVNYHSNHDMESGTNPIPVLGVVGAGTSPRPWSVHFAMILYLVSSYLYRLTLQEEGLLLLAQSLARSSLSSSSSSSTSTSATARSNNNALQWWSILPDLSLDAVLLFILMQRPMTAFFTLVGTVLFMSCVTSLVAIWRLMLQYRPHGHQHQQTWQDRKLIDETTQQHSSFYLPPSPPPKQGLVRKASLPKIPKKSCYVPLLHEEECHGDYPDIDETESSYYEDDHDDHDIYYYYNNDRGSGGNDDDNDELDVCFRPATARQHVAV